MRAITFPIIKGTSARRNAETGVEIRSAKLDAGGHEFSVWAPTADGFDFIEACSTLAAARGWAIERVEMLREVIAEAYAEAVAEHIERAARWAEAVGAPTWRARAARRMTDYAKDHAGWFANVIGEVRRLEEWTAEYAPTPAQASDAERTPEVVHHDRYGRGISCGATGRVRCEYIARLVTCKACIAADHARRVAEAERQAYTDAEDVERVDGCTRASDWLGEHVFENGEVELDPDGYDEYERCGEPTDSQRHVEGAHAAAIREDLMRAKLAQASPFYARVRTYRATHRVGLREGIQAVKDEDHTEAIGENTYRQWLDDGPECSQACRDAGVTGEGHYSDCPRRVYIVAGYSGDSQLDGVFGCRWPEDAGREPYVLKAWDMAHEHDTYRTELKAELGKFARGEDPYPYFPAGFRVGDLVRFGSDVWRVARFHESNGRPAMSLSHPTNSRRRTSVYVSTAIEWAENEAHRENAARIIAASRVPMVLCALHGADCRSAQDGRPCSGMPSYKLGLPEVPADVNDDAAWAAYCAALPRPTNQEIADVLDEYGDPYAALRAEAVRGYKNVARVLWRMRADVGRGNLSAEIEQQMRSAMRTFVGVIEVYDDLTEAWRIGNRADVDRDAATQTF